jgi:hypothetical protein
MKGVKRKIYNEKERKRNYYFCVKIVKIVIIINNLFNYNNYLSTVIRTTNKTRNIYTFTIF